MIEHRCGKAARRQASAAVEGCYAPAVKSLRRKRGQAPPEDGSAGTLGAGGGDRVAAENGPAGFGGNSAWLAIRTGDTAAVAGALGVIGASAVSWAEGIRAVRLSRQGRAVIFLAAAVDGWTLAVLGGGDLFEDNGTGSGALDLPSLSRRFGDVQKFATHRVVEYQEWQRWAGGSPVRRYCWIGESGDIRFDEGEQANAEGNLLRAAGLDDDWDAFDLADEETVMAVAAEWSIDPRALRERDDLPPDGLLGFLG
jgi:hypothetical protein